MVYAGGADPKKANASEFNPDAFAGYKTLKTAYPKNPLTGGTDLTFGPSKLVTSPSVTCTGFRTEGPSPEYNIKSYTYSC
eukprot:gene2335-490_t